MEKILWEEKFNIGNETIDNQHQYLVSLLNDLIDNRKSMNIPELRLLFNSLVHYANIHFHDEEELLLKSKYPHFLEHKKEHRDFIEKLEAIELEFELENRYVSFDMLIFLSEWLTNHILIKDKDFSSYI